MEQGTHEELMALGKEYYNLVMAQVKTSEAFEATKQQKVAKTLAIKDENDDEDTNIQTSNTKVMINSIFNKNSFWVVQFFVLDDNWWNRWWFAANRIIHIWYS